MRNGQEMILPPAMTSLEVKVFGARIRLAQVAGPSPLPSHGAFEGGKPEDMPLELSVQR